MKKHFLLLIISIVFNQLTYAQCNETNEEKILLVGDSWAAFMHNDLTLNTVLKKWGFNHFKYFSNSILAQNGAETNDFLETAKLSEIQTQLTNKSSIKLVHISLGGNDFLGNWNTSYTNSRTDSLIDTVTKRLFKIINFIKAIRPNIRVIIGGYQYSNFAEVITTFAQPTSHPFYTNWNNMGQPDNLTINKTLNRFLDTLEARVGRTTKVTFIKCTSLMQHIYGQITPLAIAPSGTYAVNSATLPAGYINYPSPKASMRNYGFFLDCFHLSPQGYIDLMNYQTQKFYHKALMEDYYVLSQGSNRDGSISNLGNISNAISLGESGSEFVSTHLSFSNKTLKDTAIARASIFIRRQSLIGNNILTATTTVIVKLKRGNFGPTPQVEAADLNDLPTATGTACVFGSYTNDADWLRLDLPTSIIPHLKNDSITQFIISIPNTSGGKLTYNNATNMEFAPILNIKYGININTIEYKKDNETPIIFPNPAVNNITFKFDYSEKREIKILNLYGSEVASFYTNEIESTKSIESLANGLYFALIKTNNAKLKILKFIKI